MTSGSGSPRARATAIRLLNWYPRPWRRRYFVEMQALLLQMPVTWRQVANLGATGAREWCSPRALGWPARSAAGRVQAARMITYITCGVAIDVAARVVASNARVAGVAHLDPVSTLFSFLQLLIAIRILVAQVRYGRNKKRHKKLPERLRPGQINGWEVGLYACVMFCWLVVRHAEPIPSYLSRNMAVLQPYLDFLSVLVWSNLTLQVTSRSRRLGRVQRSWTLRNLGYRHTRGWETPLN